METMSRFMLLTFWLCAGVNYIMLRNMSKRQKGLLLGVTLPRYAGELLALIRELYPKHFSLLPPLREGDMPFLSKLAGHRLFENADWPVEDWLACAEREAAAFAARKQAYHLY